MPVVGRLLVGRDAVVFADDDGTRLACDGMFGMGEDFDLRC